MRNVLLIVMLLTLGIGLWSLQSSDQPGPQNTPYSEKDVPPSAGVKADEDEDKVNLKGHPFELDRDRLFDRGYENDPELQAFAKAHDTPPACIIALAKYKLHGIPVEPGVCPNPYEASLKPAEGPVLPGPRDPHPYDQYPDASLKAMAEYDPAAALIFARRVENDQVSLRYYERALVLTGNPQPLVEWLNYRTAGENFSTNETIDVDQAKVGYKIYLVTSAFGLGKGVAEDYEERLVGAGVDIDAVKAEAEEITERIKKERNSLFPSGRES